MKKNDKNILLKIGYRYTGVTDDGMEFGQYFEFPDLLSFNSYLNKSLCSSERSITLRSVMLYINGKCC